MTPTPDARIEIKPSKPQWEIIKSDKQVNLFLAGQGSGKTHVAGVVSAMLISNYPKLHGFIGANTYPQLSDSTLYRIRNVWREKFGWTEWSRTNPSGHYCSDIQPPPHFNKEGHEYDTYHGKICFKWGTVVYKGSLENYKAHDGKEFAWAVLDETKDTKEEAVKEVILGRLRETGMIKNGKNWNPLFIFTSPAKVPWINEWFKLDDYVVEISQKIYSAETFFSKEVDNKLVVISSTLHNMQNLPENYIDNQRLNLSKSLQDMLLYGNPFAQSGGEFYSQFNRITHVGKFPMVSGEGFHLSSDQNIRPYFTLIAAQIFFGKEDELWHVRFIREYCLENPRNNMETCCQTFAADYSHELDSDNYSGMYFYGDASGKEEQTLNASTIKHHYQQLEATLYRYLNSGSNRVARKNASVIKRRDFINKILGGGYNIVIEIDEGCKHIIEDLTFVKEDYDGKKDKFKVKPKDESKSYEKYGHTSDAMDYLLIGAFDNLYTLFEH